MGRLHQDHELSPGVKELLSVYSGWDGLGDDEVQPWTEEDEARIASWLGDVE